MTYSGGGFFTLTILILLIVLAIFAMKYAVQIFRAKAEASRGGDVETPLVEDPPKRDHRPDEETHRPGPVDQSFGP